MTVEKTPMKLAIDDHEGEFFVWAMLDDPDYNRQPRDRGESFIIGSGDTAAAAIVDALTTLELATQQLLQRDGLVDMRSDRKAAIE